MSEISLAAINRLVKRVDQNIRVGKDAKNELRKGMEDYAVHIAESAVSIARNANRSTVLAHDILTAKEQLMKGISFHQTQMSQV